MVQKTVWLPEVGELVLSKRKGSKNIRLSISAGGKVRVGLPSWTPYAMGISFAKQRAEWINDHLQKQPISNLNDGDRIGKSYRLKYLELSNAKSVSARLVGKQVIVSSHLSLMDQRVQIKAKAAAERALKAEAQYLLSQRLMELAKKNNFTYQSVKIRKLVSRWGSCSSKKEITLNYFLMQLPWDLIDYVILHELVHTRHLNHSPSFWDEFDKIKPNAKIYRKQIKNYRPVINSLASSVA